MKSKFFSFILPLFPSLSTSFLSLGLPLLLLHFFLWHYRPLTYRSLSLTPLRSLRLLLSLSLAPSPFSSLSCSFLYFYRPSPTPSPLSPPMLHLISLSPSLYFPPLSLPPPSSPLPISSSSITLPLPPFFLPTTLLLSPFSPFTPCVSLLPIPSFSHSSPPYRPLLFLTQFPPLVILYLFSPLSLTCSPPPTSLVGV